MRIIAGEFRSRVILAPKGSDTRPTLDQTRESLFNILRDRVEDAAVLDLFAGSGALALEALSRGAKSAVLVDLSRAACGVIRRNIESLGLSSRAALYQADAAVAVDRLSKKSALFDLIFLDPPYRVSLTDTLKACFAGGLLAENGLIIAEHALQTPPVCPPGLQLIDRRDYRGTAISFYGRDSHGADEVPVSGQL